MGRGGRGDLKLAEELRALLLLRLFPRVGDRTIARLLERWGTAAAALSVPDRELRDAAGAGAVKARRDRTLVGRVDEILERAALAGADVVHLGHPGYPEGLLHLTDPPPVLFLRGNRSLLDGKIVTVVGSRRATATGRRVAERLSRAWAGEGITVASGMALGIDAAAHRGALAGPGGTIAVLGSGPDVVYPKGNWPLFRRIVEEGLIVSEFLPGEGAQPHHFPRRNRILAALASAVVVVEAAERSGALITVDHALDLGREVFVVPGSVESPQSAGANALLLDGAQALPAPGRLLDVMGWRAEPGAEEDGSAAHTGAAGELLSQLAFQPRTLDGLASVVKRPVASLLAVLTELEIRGEVRKVEGGWCRTEG